MYDFVIPKIQALLVCDRVISHEPNFEKTIVGTFTDISANSFPCWHHKVAVYICFTDACGDYDFSLFLVYLDKDIVVAKGEIPHLIVKDRLATQDFGINLPYIYIPGPGRYEWRLYVNDHWVASKDFVVKLVNPMGGTENE